MLQLLLLLQDQLLLLLLLSLCMLLVLRLRGLQLLLLLLRVCLHAVAQIRQRPATSALLLEHLVVASRQVLFGLAEGHLEGLQHRRATSTSTGNRTSIRTSTSARTGGVGPWALLLLSVQARGLMARLKGRLRLWLLLWLLLLFPVHGMSSGRVPIGIYRGAGHLLLLLLLLLVMLLQGLIAWRLLLLLLLLRLRVLSRDLLGESILGRQVRGKVLCPCCHGDALRPTSNTPAGATATTSG